LICIHLIQILFNILIERWEIGSFAKLGSCVGLCGFANVPMCVGKNYFLKCALEKIFKTFGADCVAPKSVRMFLSRCQSFVF